MQNLKIRKFQDKDRKKLLALISEVLSEIFDSKPQNIGLDKNFFGKGGTLYVAEKDDRLIGSVGLTKQKSRTARLKKMYIGKKYRKTGIAQKLYDKIQKFAKDNNYKRIILSTTPEMKEAIGFYKKNGFVRYRTNRSTNKIFFRKIL